MAVDVRSLIDVFHPDELVVGVAREVAEVAADHDPARESGVAQNLDQVRWVDRQVAVGVDLVVRVAEEGRAAELGASSFQELVPAVVVAASCLAVGPRSLHLPVVAPPPGEACRDPGVLADLPEAGELLVGLPVVLAVVDVREVVPVLAFVRLVENVEGPSTVGIRVPGGFELAGEVHAVQEVVVRAIGRRDVERDGTREHLLPADVHGVHVGHVETVVDRPLAGTSPFGVVVLPDLVVGVPGVARLVALGCQPAVEQRDDLVEVAPPVGLQHGVVVVAEVDVQSDARRDPEAGREHAALIEADAVHVRLDGPAPVVGPQAEVQPHPVVDSPGVLHVADDLVGVGIGVVAGALQEDVVLAGEVLVVLAARELVERVDQRVLQLDAELEVVLAADEVIREVADRGNELVALPVRIEGPPPVLGKAVFIDVEAGGCIAAVGRLGLTLAIAAELQIEQRVLGQHVRVVEVEQVLGPLQADGGSRGDEVTLVRALVGLVAGAVLEHAAEDLLLCRRPVDLAEEAGPLVGRGVDMVAAGLRVLLVVLERGEEPRLVALHRSADVEVDFRIRAVAAAALQIGVVRVLGLPVVVGELQVDQTVHVVRALLRRHVDDHAGVAAVLGRGAGAEDRNVLD